MADNIKQRTSGSVGGGAATGMAPVPGQPPVIDTDAVQEWLTETYKNIKTAYISFHQSAWEAILMYAGSTWIKWDTNRKMFETETPQDNWTPTPRINRFAPTMDSVTSNFNYMPEVDAIPKQEDDDPLSWGVADVASALAEDWVERSGIKADYDGNEDKLGLAAQTFTLMGSVIPKVYPRMEKLGQLPVKSVQSVMQGTCQQCDQFHPNLGQPVTGTDSYTCPQCSQQIMDPQMGQTVLPSIDPATGTPFMQDVTQYEAICEIGLPIYMLGRPGSTYSGDAPYILWAQRRSLDWIHFEIDVDADPDSEQLDGFSTAYNNELEYFYQGVSQVGGQSKDSAMVIEAYVPKGKNRTFPDGHISVMINDRVVKAVPWDVPDHPLTVIPYQKIPTLFMPRSIAFELTGIQKEYQQYESIIKLHAMTSAVDSIIIDENTIVTQPTGRADKIIKWRSIGPGSKEPHRMIHGTLDDGIYKQRQSLRDEFENISGAVSVQKGEQPGSITAASGISQLRGQAQMFYSKPQDNWNNGWKEVVRKAVRIRQKYWSIVEIAEIVGLDKLPFIQAFKQADLTKTLKWVSSSHGLPRTRDERKQEMMELFDRGALDLSDPSVRERIHELFGETGIMSAFNLDATRARMENKMMMETGQPIPPKPYPLEDSQVHLGIHLMAFKSLTFDQWKPPSQQAMLEHLQITVQQVDQLLAAQAAAAPAPGGGGGKEKDKQAPPGGGPPSPPVTSGQ